MPPPTRVIRGVRDIRTRFGTPDQTVVPYKAYMVITALEMEKFRRETERQRLTSNLSNINARLETIEAEKTALVKRLGKETKRKPSGRGTTSRPGSEGSVGGFKLQY